jgi:hypothetical protein
VVGAVAGRPVPVAVEPLLAREQAIQGGQEVVVGPCTDLDHDDAGRRVRHEDRQEAVATIGRLRRKGRAVGGDVDEAAAASGPDDQFACLYGKMLRSASRIRLSPPPAGADS